MPTHADPESPLERLQQSGITFGGDGVPWLVATKSYSMSRQQVQTLEQLTDDSFRFLDAVARLLNQGGGISEYLVGMIAGNVQRFSLAKLSSADAGQQLAMVRPDVILDSTGRFSIVEIETMIGGLGMSTAVRWAYQAQGLLGANLPGAYAKMIWAFWEQHHAKWRRHHNPDHLTVGVINPASKSSYDNEFGVLGNHLANHGVRLVVGRPEDVTLHSGHVYVSGEKIDVMHRFFRLCEIHEPHDLARLMQIVKKRYVPMIQPWVEPLEDKVLFAAFHDAQLEQIWVNALGTAAFERLKAAIPMTWLVGGSHGALVRDHFSRGRSQRLIWVKKSSDSWGGRGAFFGPDLSNVRWREVMLNAHTCYLHGEPWILQEHRAAMPTMINYLDPVSGVEETAEMAHRISPFGFWTGTDRIELAEIMVTLRADNKVHGATNATMVPAEVS